MMTEATIDDFGKLDIRVGRICSAEPFVGGRSSSHILMIDLGPEVGTRKSLARLSPNYDGVDLVGRQVLCIVNLPPRQIGTHQSEVLSLGVPDDQQNVVLIQPDADVPIGGRLY